MLLMITQLIRCSQYVRTGDYNQIVCQYFLTWAIVGGGGRGTTPVLYRQHRTGIAVLMRTGLDITGTDGSWVEFRLEETG